MNIYDTIQISCIMCGKIIGEVDFDTEIIRPKCGKCANPLPDGEKIIYTASVMKRQSAVQSFCEINTKRANSAVWKRGNN